MVGFYFINCFSHREPGGMINIQPINRLWMPSGEGARISIVGTNLMISPTFTKKFEVLVPILEQLAAAEETVVREEAIRSLIKISDKLSQDETSGVIVPCILRLANAESFTNKVSAINLMSATFDKAGVHQETLRK